MFTNRISRIQRLSTRTRRYSSHTQATYPFTKLRAFPFCISPEDAIVQIAPYASSLCLFKQFVGSLGARYLPGFGFKPFQPVRITPVYFPGWFIDAEISADFKIEDSLNRASGVTQASYLPGSDFRVLSLVPYRFDGGADHDPVPFTEELTHQHGVDVTCIPYTISPFAVFDLAQSATDPIQLQDSISFVPSSIHTDMFAAYPVLFPLYLAQYEYPFPGQERLITLFIEAATPHGRIHSEQLVLADFSHLPIKPQVFVDFAHVLRDIDVLHIRGKPEFFSQFSSFPLLERRRIASASIVNHWLNDTAITPGVGQKLAKKSGIITSDSDPRIRTFTAEERKPIQRWLSLSQQIEAMARVAAVMQKTLESSSESTQLAKDSAIPEIPQDTHNTIKSLEHKIAELRAKQDAVTPLWWKEWRHTSQ